MKRALFVRLLPGVVLFAALVLLSPIRAAELGGEEIHKRALKSTVWILVRDGDKMITGSGSLIDAKQKLVLTNYHVIMDMGIKDTCLVQFPMFDKKNNVITEKSKYFEAIKSNGAISATILCYDKAKDLAIVKLANLPKGAEAVRLGENTPGSGANIHSIGNPGASDALFGYCPGVVRNSYVKKWSAGGGGVLLNFEARIIETTSPTTFGDSGGPLFNSKGEQIGVTQGGSGDPKASLYSYFIDISEIRTLLNRNKVLITPQAQVVSNPMPKGETPEPETPETKTAEPKTEPTAKVEPKKAEPKTEVKGAADERAAENRLGLIKTLIDQGKKEVAAQRLSDLIKSYPGTEAAKEAKELLKKLK